MTSELCCPHGCFPPCPFDRTTRPAIEELLEQRDALWRTRIERHLYGLTDMQDVSVGYVRLLLACVCKHGWAPGHCASEVKSD